MHANESELRYWKQAFVRVASIAADALTVMPLPGKVHELWLVTQEAAAQAEGLPCAAVTGPGPGATCGHQVHRHVFEGGAHPCLDCVACRGYTS